MKKSANVSALRIVLLVAFVVLPMRAQAYVDPGAGVLLWQGLIALLGFVIFFLRNPIQAIKSIFKRKFGKKPEEHK
jgi:hypothetical protein